MLIGWKAISEATNGVSPDTLRKWMREEGLPVAMEGKTPMTTERLLSAWVEKRVKKKMHDFEGFSAENEGFSADN